MRVILTSNKIEKEYTERGFGLYEFEDRNGYACSIQKSSIASEDCIWLGISEDKVQILATDARKAGLDPERLNGWVNFELPKGALIINRMHLTQEQVREILPILYKFSETGEI